MVDKLLDKLFELREELEFDGWSSFEAECGVYYTAPADAWEIAYGETPPLLLKTKDEYNYYKWVDGVLETIDELEYVKTLVEYAHFLLEEPSE